MSGGPGGRRRRLLVWFGLTAVVAWLGCAWFAAREISRPGRRALEPHHLQILNAPGEHGIQIESFSASDGTPVLLCRPDSAAKLDERGIKLRGELLARGLVLSAPGLENGATLVLLHGRRGRKEDNLPVAIRFCAAGFRCLLPDLPGHGDHPSKLASYGPRESGLPLLVLQEAAAQYGFPAQPAGLWGISMGGSVAVHAAAETPEAWDALVVVASFDALGPVIERQSGQYLGPTFGALFYPPVKTMHVLQTGLSLDEIQPVTLAAQVTTPALMAHGDDDPLIPPKAARRLFEALGSAKTKWVNVGSGTHGNVLITSYPLYADMAGWLFEHTRPVSLR